jgi:hypothetical protein
MPPVLLREKEQEEKNTFLTSTIDYFVTHDGEKAALPYLISRISHHILATTEKK